MNESRRQFECICVCFIIPILFYSTLIDLPINLFLSLPTECQCPRDTTQSKSTKNEKIYINVYLVFNVYLCFFCVFLTLLLLVSFFFVFYYLIDFRSLSLNHFLKTSTPVFFVQKYVSFYFILFLLSTQKLSLRIFFLFVLLFFNS